MKKPQHNNQEKPQHQNTVNQSAAPSTPRRGRATQRTGEAHTVKSSQVKLFKSIVHLTKIKPAKKTKKKIKQYITWNSSA